MSMTVLTIQNRLSYPHWIAIPTQFESDSCIVFARSFQSPHRILHVNCIADCPTCLPVQTEVFAAWAVWADGGLCARPQRELPGESERPGMAALPAVQMVVVAAWDRRSVRVCACPRSEEHTSELQSLRHLVC